MNVAATLRSAGAAIRNVGAAVSSAAVWVSWALLLIVWTPLVAVVTLATYRRDPARRTAGRLFRRCPAIALWLNPFWRVRRTGDRPAPGAHPFVCVCNHESLADVVVLGALPWEMKWLAKRAIFRLPFQGWMMRMVGDVSVRRSDPESRGEAYGELKKLLALGMSVMIFPEGTRSRTADLLRFRNGAFRLAIETGTPILPLAVSGTRNAIRKGSLRFRPAEMNVRILEPIPVAALGPKDVAELRDRVRDMIDAARRNAAGESRAACESRGDQRAPTTGARSHGLSAPAAECAEVRPPGEAPLRYRSRAPGSPDSSAGHR